MAYRSELRKIAEQAGSTSKKCESERNTGLNAVTWCSGGGGVRLPSLGIGAGYCLHFLKEVVDIHIRGRRNVSLLSIPASGIPKEGTAPGCKRAS